MFIIHAYRHIIQKATLVVLSEGITTAIDETCHY
jgi:hypothetical protein